MKYILKNINSIVFALLFISAIVLYSLKIIDSSAFIGALGAIATIYYGSLKMKIENDILFKELFQAFNDRYGKEINDLINELRANESKPLNTDEKNLIIDYFNLCAEEFLWKSKRRIPSDVWKAWRSGIIENLKIRQIRELYNQETNSTYGKASYYGLFEELQKSVTNA